MFEDALVESSGKLRYRSKYWMFATFAFNLSTVAVLALVPLLHPEALPRTALTATLIAPPPPPAAPPRTPVRVAQPVRTAAPLNPMVAPARVPARISMDKDAPPPSPATGPVAGAAMNGGDSDTGVLAALGTAEPSIAVTPVPPKARPARVPISAGVAAGAVLSRTTPTYPAIAKSAHVSGSVVLHAVISRDGIIEGLQVVSGPEMLRASALDAVRQWRYRPYLLNGEPVEVETTVTVNFTFGG